MSSSIVTLSIFFLAMELIAFAAGYLYLEGRKLKKQTTQTPNNFDEKSGAGADSTLKCNARLKIRQL